MNLKDVKQIILGNYIVYPVTLLFVGIGVFCVCAQLGKCDMQMDSNSVISIVNAIAIINLISIAIVIAINIYEIEIAIPVITRSIPKLSES